MTAAEVSGAARAPVAAGSSESWSTRAALRHSVGAAAVPAVVLLVALNTLVRPMDWTREWLWAIWAFHFVTIFLGPLAAGLGAWEGHRLARSGALVAASGGAARAVAATWASLLAWVAVPYVCVLCLVLVVLKVGAGMPGAPDAAALSTVGPALALVAAATAVGIGAGARARSPLAAPLAAVLTFAATLVGYLAITKLVRVGGATASLVGLRPRPLVQGIQLTLYASLAFAGLSWARSSLGDRTARGPLARLPLGVAALCVVAAQATSGIELVEWDEPLHCTAGEPQVCVAEGYRDRARAVVDAVDPYLAHLRSADVAVPRRLVQHGGDAPLGVASISFGLLVRDDVGDVPFMLVDAWVPPGCDVLATPELLASWQGLVYWVGSAGGQAQDLGDLPDLPSELRSGDAAVSAAWAGRAIDALQSCRPA